MESLAKIAAVFLSSMLKFIFGPTLGFGLNLHFVTTVLSTVSGMMTAVIIVTYFGDWIRRRWMPKYTPPSAGSKWQRYGLPGVAFLTPIILTPIGGTILALGSGSAREKIIFYMFLSASFWALLFTGAIYFVGQEVLEWLPDFAR